MATWSLVAPSLSIGSGSRKIRVVQAIGTNIYFVSTTSNGGAYWTTGQVYEYNTLTNVLTQILDPANVSWSNIRGMAQLNGYLYFITTVAGDPLTETPSTGFVYRWTGSVDGVVQVHQLYELPRSLDPDIDRLAPSVLRMHSDLSTMIVAMCNDAAFDDSFNEVHYTSGAGWGIGGFPFEARDVFVPNNFNSAAYHPQGIFEMFVDNATGTWKATRWAGTSLALHQASMPGESAALMGSTPGGGTTHWSDYVDNTYYMNYAMTVATQPDPDIYHFMDWQMPYACGMKNDGINGSGFYQFNGTGWTYLENINSVSTHPQFYNPNAVFVRTSDGEVWLIGETATGPYQVWQRGEPIPFPEAGGSRVWIYKTTDNGDSWASRGIITP